MGLASEYRSRNRGSSVGVGALVALGIATVCVAGVMLGLWISDRDKIRAAPKTSIRTNAAPTLVTVRPTPTPSNLTSEVRAQSQHALGEYGITRTQAEALVVQYGPDTWSVTGTCKFRDNTSIYETTHRRTSSRWELVTVLVNGERWFPAGALP